MTVAREILAIVGPQARRRIEHLLALDANRLQDLLGDALKRLEDTRSDQRRNRAEVRQVIGEIRAGRVPLDAALLPLIDQRRLTDIAVLLSELAEVSETHLSNVLHKVNGSGIAAICRVVNVSDQLYERLSLLRCEKLRLPITQLRPMLRQYQSLPHEAAVRALKPHRMMSVEEILSEI